MFTLLAMTIPAALTKFQFHAVQLSVVYVVGREGGGGMYSVVEI